MNWETFGKRQKTVAKVLRNAVRKGELAHAYLLEGPRGSGKVEAAMLLAETLFCEQPRDGGEPCRECRNCRRIISGNHPDVLRIRPEEGAATIKKDQIAHLIHEFTFQSVESDGKVLMIEQAEKMTPQAENSLLKFIEEPLPGILVLLITDHVHQLLETIVSRCQVLTFVALPQKAVAEKLTEQGISAELARLAAALTNDYEESLRLCKNEWIAKARDQVLQLFQRLYLSQESVLPFIYETFSLNFDSTQKIAVGLDMMLLWYRDLLSLHLGRSEKLVYSDQTEALKAQMLRFSETETLRAMTLILEAGKQLDAHVNGVSVIERLVIRLGGVMTS